MVTPVGRRRALLVTSLVAFAVLSPFPLAAQEVTSLLVLDASAPAGSSVMPIINVGDEVGSDFTFEGIPDGIGAKPGAVAGTVDVFVNHEQSTVPFPLPPDPTAAADFVDSSVSQLTLDTSTAAVLAASVPIGPENGFIRFCSSTMAGPNEGLDRYLYFTNEESNDIVDVPADAPYGADPSLTPKRQAGYAVVLDPATGEFTDVPSMGRLNHENDMVIPGGWDKLAVLTGDDTFFTSPFPDWSQLFLYLTDNEESLFADHGRLFGFRVTATDESKVDASDPFNGANDYGDIQPGDEWQGRFVRVPKVIAKGLTSQAPQDALEDWANSRNVFQFIRVEDTAYDVNDPHVVYIADTGDGRMIPEVDPVTGEPTTGRLTRGPRGTVGAFPNGRVYRMEFSPNNPRRVVSFSILLDNDAAGLGNPSVMHQPDNLGTSTNSLMVQEDTSQEPGARVWRYDFATQTWSVVASVVDGTSNESSGIVDASEWFGDGAWLLDVQAHNDIVDEDLESRPGIRVKREGGQLLLMKIPGS